jgi:transposase
MRRHEISDEAWNRIKDHLPGKEGDPVLLRVPGNRHV